LNNYIFLPGTNKQLEILLNNFPLNLSAILIIGNGCEEIARQLRDRYSYTITIIVDNNDSLLNTRLTLAEEKDISIKLMDYANTDFTNEKFDLIYAQASVSSANRNKIVKEIKRILKPGGYFCVGEIVKLNDNPPKFINDIWENSGLKPLRTDEFGGYYSSRNFEILNNSDQSETLKEFYTKTKNLLEEKSGQFSDREKSYYKKLLNQIRHESNAYLKLGGDRHIGFRALLLRKV